MGQVPRLQATAFDEPREPVRIQPWIFVAVGLAMLAVGVALYAVLRPSVAPDASTTALAAIPSSRMTDAALEQVPSAATVTPAALAEGPGQGADAEMETAKPASASALTPPLRLTDPEDLSVEPQVLVVPAAPRPGEHLPRGADELRRALLGPDASPSIERRQPSPDPDRAPPERHFTPVPPELIAEIEEFKRTYQTGTSSAPDVGQKTDAQQSVASTSTLAKQSTSNNAPTSQQASSNNRPGPLPSNIRRQLPPFLMTVHVFDEDPARRFIYLNGSKVREGELTRDGFFVEQVLADGAIVRYDDHRFFESP